MRPDKESPNLWQIHLPMNIAKKTALTLAIGAGLLTSVQASVVSIDFTGVDNNISGGYPPWGAPTTPMASNEVAGVVAAANWNSFSQNVQASAVSLVDSTGANSGVTLTWSAPYGAQTTIDDTPGDYRMMRGGLWTSGDTISVTISIPEDVAEIGYQLFAYGDTNSTVIPDVARQFGMAVVVNGESVFGNQFLYDGANTDFAGQYLLSSGAQSWPAVQDQSNYFAFDTLYATEVTLVVFNFAASDNNSYWAQLSGIQVVSVPEPSTLAFGAMALLGLGYRPLRRLTQARK